MESFLLLFPQAPQPTQSHPSLYGRNVLDPPHPPPIGEDGMLHMPLGMLVSGLAMSFAVVIITHHGACITSTWRSTDPSLREPTKSLTTQRRCATTLLPHPAQSRPLSDADRSRMLITRHSHAAGGPAARGALGSSQCVPARLRRRPRRAPLRRRSTVRLARWSESAAHALRRRHVCDLVAEPAMVILDEESAAQLGRALLPVLQ